MAARQAAYGELGHRFDRISLQRMRKVCAGRVAFGHSTVRQAIFSSRIVIRIPRLARAL